MEFDLKACKGVVCEKCGTHHFQVSLEFATHQVAEFNAFYKNLDAKGKKSYGGPSSVERYKRCIRCGGSYKDFRDLEQVEVDWAERMGFTINPILDRTQ